MDMEYYGSIYGIWIYMDMDPHHVFSALSALDVLNNYMDHVVE